MAQAPSLHKAYLETMVQRVFSRCTTNLELKLAKARFPPTSAADNHSQALTQTTAAALTPDDSPPPRRRLLPQVADEGKAIDMEAQFSQLTLDVIGMSVFNYDFDALTADRRARAGSGALRLGRGGHCARSQ